MDQGAWVIVMKLGPFYDLDLAGRALAEWSDGTRGPGPRVAQALCLRLRDVYKSHGVELYVIDQSKQVWLHTDTRAHVHNVCED